MYDVAKHKNKYIKLKTTQNWYSITEAMLVFKSLVWSVGLVTRVGNYEALIHHFSSRVMSIDSVSFAKWIIKALQE